MSVAGDRIKKLREREGLTQLDLANKIGINNSVLSRIEAGKRPVEDVEMNAFADFFDVTTDYLLGRTDYPKGYQTNMSFYGGPEQYTQDEIEEMEAALERYRDMKRRAAEQAKKDSKK
ncbi:helix-turn-helix transcriptional regulator [Paenibacillus sp. F411]|uniref:helix-turn-helix domain-containing protein n=1 Tax=Paenibacillus sp. F411 TaxID=2820239 RepID=UPI001FB9D40E|nr:helix-turn-helix transcriptional regulator [Paenibacillus sp. F411]